MRKTYQNEEIDTSQPAVPEQVSVALGELAGEMREGLLALAVGPNRRRTYSLTSRAPRYD